VNNVTYVPDWSIYREWAKHNNPFPRFILLGIYAYRWGFMTTLAYKGVNYGEQKHG
jgi:hypothetical protein